MFENKLITFRENMNKVTTTLGRQLQLPYLSLKCTEATSNNEVLDFSVLNRRQKNLHI